MPKVNIAVVVGSNRRDSINRRLARALTRLAADKLASTFVQIDDLPMYNQDLESPLPESVARFKRELEAAGALLIFTPEHNRSIPAVLKNAIDWGARPYGHNSWADKPAAIIGASPGAIGTASLNNISGKCSAISALVVMGGEAYSASGPISSMIGTLSPMPARTPFYSPSPIASPILPTACIRASARSRPEPTGGSPHVHTPGEEDHRNRDPPLKALG